MFTAASTGFPLWALDTGMIARNVRELGATGDGITLDTRAIQRAVDLCHDSGGGVVYFPSGGQFLTGTIYLKDHVKLHIDIGARVIGSSDMSQYGDDTGSNPYYPEPIDRCLIYGRGLKDIALGGAGTIIGCEAERYLPVPNTTDRDAKQRPMLIKLENCSRITISDLNIERCGAWAIYIKNSSDFSLRDLQINNQGQDGIVVDGCSSGTIANCRLLCGDDCIALVTSSHENPIYNLSITGCELRSHWAGVRFGPASKGNFENIIVSNSIFHDCDGGAVKLGMYEGAEIRDCIFHDLVMQRVTSPINIMVTTWPEIGTNKPDRAMMPLGRIHDLQFRGVRATTKGIPPAVRPDQGSCMFIHGHPESAIENVTLTDVDASFAGGGTAGDAQRRNMMDMNLIDFRRGGYWTDDKDVWGVPPAYGLYARHVKGFALNNLTFSVANPDLRSPLFCSDCEEISISGFEAHCADGGSMVTARNCSQMALSNLRPKGDAVLLRLEGKESKGVTLVQNDPRQFRKLFECYQGASAKAVISR
jgi:Glycosyl hydrolases family 28